MSMCIDPTLFGPYYWAVIHISCLAAGTDLSGDKLTAMNQFVNSLPEIIPCLECQEHLKANLATLPFDSSDPFKWSVNLHNLVSSQIGKKTMSYSHALKLWENKMTKPKHPPYLTIFILSLMVMIGIFYAYKKVYR